MTLNGPGGTDTTIVINATVTLIGTMLACDDTVKVCAPTSVAAFSAGGEILHHLLTNKAGAGSHEPHSMDAMKRKLLTERIENLLCLIIDEMSLLDSTLLSVSEQMVSETVHDDTMAHKSLPPPPLFDLQWWGAVLWLEGAKIRGCPLLGIDIF